MFAVQCVTAQTLSLEECRQMAINNNKKLSAARMKQEVADNAKEIARTQYLPKVQAIGSYLHTSKDISLLNSDQKSLLNNLGTVSLGAATEALPGMMQDMVAGGLLTPDQVQSLQQLVGKYGPAFAEALNNAGNEITDAFNTKTRNIWAGSIMVTQPLYMGGRITSLNKIADINRELVANQSDNIEQEILISTEKAYWLVVSLKQKQKLATDFHELLKKLHSDVEKMVAEGVATKADELSVSVKVNEAEMTLTQVDNGLALAKMALCQICGLPIKSEITLADEGNQSLSTVIDDQALKGRYNLAIENRPEIKMLANATDIAREGIKLASADYKPTLALTGGYIISNPNVFNGFQRKFSGVWNVGVLFSLPIWNWGETKYKIRAAKAATNIAEMQLSDAKEMIELQVNQNEFKLNEAQKRVDMTHKNIKSADENLRAATLGFKEGVMTTSNVLEAQTAWLKAQTQKIDAEVDLKLATAEMKKALGIIKY
ncbi:MAG: TolC family protein [Prevotellaceae bacterium]|nr:TolC family protein [Prevotellaceae bacterium]